MGKITVFTLDDCPFCKKAKELLKSKGVEFDVISLTQVPAWRPLMYLLTNGKTPVDMGHNHTMISTFDVN